MSRQKTKYRVKFTALTRDNKKSPSMSTPLTASKSQAESAFELWAMHTKKGDHVTLIKVTEEKSIQIRHFLGEAE